MRAESEQIDFLPFGAETPADHKKKKALGAALPTCDNSSTSASCYADCSVTLFAENRDGAPAEEGGEHVGDGTSWKFKNATHMDMRESGVTSKNQPTRMSRCRRPPKISASAQTDKFLVPPPAVGFRSPSSLPPQVKRAKVPVTQLSVP